jgi:hypothetical protein
MGLVRTAALWVSARSRARKLRYLDARIPPGSSVLFVGVSRYARGPSDNIIERGLSDGRRAFGLMYEPVLSEKPLAVPLVRADALRLPFKDHSIDYLISNAVLEHVGGPEAARAMVRECERVARLGVFHTTPDRAFPIEVHTRVPLLHWLPHSRQEAVFRRVGKRFPPSKYWLFTRRSLRSVVGPDYAISRQAAMTLMAERQLSGRSAHLPAHRS